MYLQAVESVKSYDRDAVFAAVARELDALGIRDDLLDSTKVLIKPNLLSDSNPYFAITTNPVVVEAIVDWLIKNGVKSITLADSPGGALTKMRSFSYDEFYEKTGMGCLKNIISLNTDSGWSQINAPLGSKNKSFNVLNAVCEADYIINVPKLKTHNLTAISFGIKNLFGCVPDIQKPAFHAKYPGMKEFSNMLVELALAVKPALTVVDAVEILEGNGPVYGEKKNLGLVFASKDLFSQDCFIAELLGVDTSRVEMLSNAKARGLVQEAKIIGTFNAQGVEPVMLPDAFREGSPAQKIKSALNIGAKKAKKALFIYYPNVEKDNCTGCARCAASCPQGAIKISGSAQINYDKCIKCFCCNEVCPSNGITVKRKFKI